MLPQSLAPSFTEWNLERGIVNVLKEEGKAIETFHSGTLLLFYIRPHVRATKWTAGSHTVLTVVLSNAQ